MDFASEERLTVVDHPLIKHKLSVIRNEDTPDYLFRQTATQPPRTWQRARSR